jgi:hypothetical protein
MRTDDAGPDLPRNATRVPTGLVEDMQMNPQRKEPNTRVTAQPLHSSTSEFDSELNELKQAAQLGWAAGFLDGEGCIHIARQRYRTARADTYRLGVHMGQNDRDTLEYFRAVVGIDAPIFAVKRCPSHRRQCYTLNYTGKRALQLLVMLTPYLQRKRREAKAAQAFWSESRVEHSGGKRLEPEVVARREHFFDLLKSLK